jgi:hypothetical protein
MTDAVRLGVTVTATATVLAHPDARDLTEAERAHLGIPQEGVK